MITINNFLSPITRKGFNKCIDLEVNIRVLLEIKNKELQDFRITSSNEKDEVGTFIADELEDKGIDIVLKLIQKLNNDQYEKLIEGT